MKKRKYLPLFILLALSFIILGLNAYLQTDKSQLANDNKSKLTLINNAQKSISKIPLLRTLIAKNIAKQNAAEEMPEQDYLTAERLYTEKEINEMTEDRFVELIKYTSLRMPKQTDLKNIPAGALHRTPTIVIQAGRDLGVIKEVLKIHESYERVATPFYKDCAKNAEGTTTVRALCLTNLIEIKKKNNQSLNLSEYPVKLIELSKMVIDI